MLTVNTCDGPELLAEGLEFVARVAPVLTTALIGFQSFREYHRLSQRSQGMAEDLSRYKAKLEDAENMGELTMVIQELDELMLRENQDWLGLMRYVELNVG
jgi:hypothetical protein